MNLGLEGITVLVTGGASGIGAEVASCFAQEGASVVVADVNEHAALEHARAISGERARTLGVGADVTDCAEVDRLIEASVGRFGSLDVVVNNAGFTRDTRIEKMSETDWDAVVDVILKGAFLVSRSAVTHLRKSGRGRIINISSRAHMGNPGQVNYSAAKAGLLGFTRSLAMEEGRHFTTVNAVAPGIIDTAAVTSLPHYDSIKTRAEQTTPIPRVGKTRDVAAAVLFLASVQASYITGEVLHVTGGRY